MSFDFRNMKKGQKLTIEGELFWFIEYVRGTNKTGWKLSRKKGGLLIKYVARDENKEYMDVEEGWHERNRSQERSV